MGFLMEFPEFMNFEFRVQAAGSPITDLRAVTHRHVHGLVSTVDFRKVQSIVGNDLNLDIFMFNQHLTVTLQQKHINSNN